IAAALSRKATLGGTHCEFLWAQRAGITHDGGAAAEQDGWWSFPVRHAQQMLGELIMASVHGGLTPAMVSLGQGVAKCCAYLIKRQQAQAWSESHLQRSLSIAGVSAAVWAIDAFVERAADSWLPVIIRGEFGSEKDEAAVLLHASGPWQQGPLVMIDCADPVGDPEGWFERAAGGTLVLRGIDELEEALQRRLPQCMRGWQGWGKMADGNGGVRVIASTTADLAQRVRNGHFSHALLAQLDFLALTLAPLRERAADIAFHVDLVLERHGLQSRELVTDGVMEALRRYRWPDNLSELERVLLRLAVMAGNSPIMVSDLHRHAPRLAECLPQETQDDAPPTGQSAEDGPVGWPRTSIPFDWIPGLLHRPGQRFATLHDALRRALVYLGEHYADPLTLADLAQQAHVSQSHLGFLFREELGTTFKPLLQQLRIEKAKDLLQMQPKLRITEVALKVGFGDLSHFEKSFRRLVGVSPREFRNADSGGGVG
ncbi:AraC family transcriptional regulator, partial [Xanthomonas maliensis]